jgi:hypothetical protein
MPGQPPPLKFVAFTTGPALGTVGVVVGVRVAAKVDVPLAPVDPVSIVTTPIAVSAAAAPHRNIILRDPRPWRGMNRVDFIGTRLRQSIGFPGNSTVVRATT